MLIVVEPKSASSAFARGLSDLVGVKTIQRQLEPHKNYVLHVLNGGRGVPPSKEIAFHPEFPVLSRIHPDTNEIPEKLIRRFMLSDTTLYKQAVIPIDRHLNLIQKYLPFSRGLIVLVRHPADAVNAYRKHFSHGNGLYDIDPSYWGPAERDHRRFVARYIEAFGRDPRVHFVCYERLMLYTDTVINECLAFLGFDARAPVDYQLPQKRFTGQGLEQLATNIALKSHFSSVPWDFHASDLIAAYGLDPPTK